MPRENLGLGSSPDLFPCKSTSGLPAQPPQVPAVDDGGKDEVVHGRGYLPDTRQAYGSAQPTVPRHLGPKHQERRYARSQLPLMQHVKPPGRRIGIDPPLAARIRVQIVEPYWKPCVVAILRVMLDLEAADRAVGVEKHSSFGILSHGRRIGWLTEKPTRALSQIQRPIHPCSAQQLLRAWGIEGRRFSRFRPLQDRATRSHTDGERRAPIGNAR